MNLLIIANVVLAFAWIVFRLAKTIPGLWGPELLNNTDDWTPGPERDAPVKWSGTKLLELGRRIIDAHLEPGETLEGFANGYFSPPRRVDWNPARLKRPLMIAATPRRLMMFEINNGMTVQQFCFVDWSTIRYLRPPKTGVGGTSGPLRFGLTSGHEYQVGFLGPLLNAEGMRQEQRLAAYLRGIAPRFASAPESRAA